MDASDSKDEPLLTFFEPIQPPIAEPPSAEEKRIVHHYRTLRARIHDGPLYTVKGDSHRVTKSGQHTPPTAFFDPFEGQPTYTQRYKKKRNTLPRLSTRVFVKSLFPKELWSTIDPSDKTHLKKTLNISTRTRLDNYMALSHLDPDDEERLDDGDEDADEDKDDDDKDPDAEKEKDDEDDADPDQFDEDDEDENDDYNAEQYFEGGDDDDAGDDAGGGEDDGY